MRRSWGFLVLLIVIRAVGPTSAGAAGTGFFPDWTAIAAGFYPLSPDDLAQPVLTAADVTDAHASFVADPFLFRTPDLWYMFFEVTVPRGKIALASSVDGLRWKYEHIVLDETFQISYPNVFQWDGAYYMTPESTAKLAVRLYRAENFPDSWTYVGNLVSGRDFADPQVFRYDGRWWMFVGNGPSDTCYLYWSDTLESGWVEHPASPIVAGNRGRARPGGRAVVLAGNRLHRLAQNSTPTYGRALRVFRVDQMTLTTYQEHEIPESPILQASGSGWNADGMHQCDPVWIGDRWLAVVDGVSGGVWSIGIYHSPKVAPEIEPVGRPDGRLLDVRCAPNPFGTSTSIVCRIPAGVAEKPGRLVICDPRGRVLLSCSLPASATGIVPLAWPGTDPTGRPVPAGVYFCTLQVDGREATTRIVVVR